MRPRAAAVAPAAVVPVPATALAALAGEVAGPAALEADALASGARAAGGAAVAAPPRAGDLDAPALEACRGFWLGEFNVERGEELSR